MEVREKNRLDVDASCIARLNAPNSAPRNMPGTDSFEPGAINSSTGLGRGNGDSQYANPVTWYQEGEHTAGRSNGYLRQSLLLRFGSQVTQLQMW